MHTLAPQDVQDVHFSVLWCGVVGTGDIEGAHFEGLKVMSRLEEEGNRGLTHVSCKQVSIEGRYRKTSVEPMWNHAWICLVIEAIEKGVSSPRE